MSKIMEGDAGKSGPRQERHEGPLAEVRWVDEVADVAGKDEAPILVQLVGLARTVALERLDGLGRETDGAAAARHSGHGRPPEPVRLRARLHAADRPPPRRTARSIRLLTQGVEVRRSGAVRALTPSIALISWTAERVNSAQPFCTSICSDGVSIGCPLLDHATFVTGLLGAYKKLAEWGNRRKEDRWP